MARGGKVATAFLGLFLHSTKSLWSAKRDTVSPGGQSYVPNGLPAGELFWIGSIKSQTDKSKNGGENSNKL